MKFKGGFPCMGLAGTTNNSQLTYTTIKGSIYARAKVAPSNPRSVDQQLVRARVSEVTKNWDTLTRAQQKAWELYARQYMLPADRAHTSAGLSGYLIANVNRRLFGLALTTDAPVEAPPAIVGQVEQLGAQNPDALGLALHHPHSVVAGLVVVVRMTGATATTGRKPQPGDLRFVCGATAASVAPLPASGDSVVFSPTRYVVNDGQRYGVEVRVVRTADGVPSEPVFGDFLKSV